MTTVGDTPYGDSLRMFARELRRALEAQQQDDDHQAEREEQD